MKASTILPYHKCCIVPNICFFIAFLHYIKRNKIGDTDSKFLHLDYIPFFSCRNDGCNQATSGFLPSPFQHSYLHAAHNITESHVSTWSG